MISPATSRTWPTEPAALVSSRGVERLHRVDHAHLGALALERREHGLQIGLGDHRDLAAPRRCSGARPAAGSAPPTPRPRRTASGGRRRPGWPAPSSSASTCRSPARRRSARASRARSRRRARCRARRSRCSGVVLGRRRHRPSASGATAADACRRSPRRRPGGAPRPGCASPPRACSTRRSRGTGRPTARSRGRRPSRRESWRRAASRARLRAGADVITARRRGGEFVRALVHHARPVTITETDTRRNALRAWQTGALEALAGWRGGPFLLCAAPGAGKTRPALQFARG